MAVVIRQLSTLHWNRWEIVALSVRICVNFSPCGETRAARERPGAISCWTSLSSRGSVLDQDHVGGEARVAIDHGALAVRIGKLSASEVFDGASKMGIEARVAGIPRSSATGLIDNYPGGTSLH